MKQRSQKKSRHTEGRNYDGGSNEPRFVGDSLFGDALVPKTLCTPFDPPPLASSGASRSTLNAEQPSWDRGRS